MGHVVDKLVLGQAFLLVPRCSLVIANPHMLHTRLHLHLALTRKTNGRSLGTFPKISSLSDVGEHRTEKYEAYSESKYRFAVKKN